MFSVYVMKQTEEGQFRRMASPIISKNNLEGAEALAQWMYGPYQIIGPDGRIVKDTTVSE